MHVAAVLNAIKKRGHFKYYDRAQKAYEEAEKVAESAEAGLALLEESSAGTTSKCKKKALTKAKEAKKEALVKAQETEPETKDAEEAPRGLKTQRKLASKLILRRPSKPRRLLRAQ